MLEWNKKEKNFERYITLHPINKRDPGDCQQLFIWMKLLWGAIIKDTKKLSGNAAEIFNGGAFKLQKSE